MTDPAQSPILEIRELSEILGVSRVTILHNRKTHPLYSKAFQVGGKRSRLKWYRTDVDAYLNTQREGISL